MSDAEGIMRVVSKLLDNAVKFTPNAGNLGVEVAEDRAYDVVAVTVWDTGIGIPANQLAAIFRPFEQLDHGLDRQYEGVGLGLAYVQQMVRLLGGTIHAESEVGKGSRFTVMLPIQSQKEPSKSN